MAKRSIENVISHNQLLDFRSKRIAMPWSQGIFQFIFDEQRNRDPLLPIPSPPPGLFSGGGASVQQTPAEALPALASHSGSHSLLRWQLRSLLRHHPFAVLGFFKCRWYAFAGSCFFILQDCARGAQDNAAAAVVSGLFCVPDRLGPLVDAGSTRSGTCAQPFFAGIQ